jgi:hypothetical protein
VTTPDLQDYLQNPHSIDVLLAILEISSDKKRHNEELVIGWNEVKMHIQKTGVVCSDTTFRHRRDELVEIGVLELVPIDILRDNVKLTVRGFQAACIVKKFCFELNAWEGIN